MKLLLQVLVPLSGFLYDLNPGDMNERIERIKRGKKDGQQQLLTN